MIKSFMGWEDRNGTLTAVFGLQDGKVNINRSMGGLEEIAVTKPQIEKLLSDPKVREQYRGFYQEALNSYPRQE